MFSQLVGNQLELLDCMQSLRENHVSSSVDEDLGSFDALVESVDTFGISSGTDHKFSIRHLYTCLPCDPDLISHLLGRNQLLSVQVTTPFRENLILDMKSSSSGEEKVMNCPCTHLSLTKASIRIHNNRKIRKGCNIPYDIAKLVHCSESDIGYSG